MEYSLNDATYICFADEREYGAFLLMYFSRSFAMQIYFCALLTVFAKQYVSLGHWTYVIQIGVLSNYEEELFQL